MYLNAKRYQLENGLIVLLCCNRTMPIVSANAFIRVGKDQNPISRPGLASLTSRLLDEGTHKYSSRELSQLIESAGCELSSFSEREITGICLQLESFELGLAIELLSEMVTRPTFPRERFEMERRKVLNHIQSMKDDPEAVGSQTLNRCIYQGSPLAEPVLGNSESLQQMSVEELQRFHRQKYGPENTILTIVGDLDLQATVELVDAFFSKWSNPHLQLRQLPKILNQTKPLTRAIPIPKEQSTIFLGHLGIERTNQDFYALQVVDTILGGGPGFTSRIPRQLRDNRGLAYAAYADLTASSGVYPGRFAAYLCTSPEHRQEALAGLLAEIKNLTKEGVEEEELEAAKDFLTGSFAFEFQGNASIARYLLACELFQLEDDYPDYYRDAVQAVTRAEAIRVARKYLDTVNYTTVVVGSV
jgi:zinc protease